MKAEGLAGRHLVEELLVLGEHLGALVGGPHVVQPVGECCEVVLGENLCGCRSSSAVEMIGAPGHSGEVSGTAEILRIDFELGWEGAEKRVMSSATGERPVMIDAREGTHWGLAT